MATTPPPHQAVNTPPTPLHGAKYDSYQPYQSRKSTRSTLKPSLRAALTPPPPTSNRSNHNLRSSSSSTSPKFTRLNLSKQSSHTFSPPSSAQSSPQRKGATKVVTPGRITRSSDSSKKSSKSAAPVLELPQDHHSNTVSLSSSAGTNGAAMLPTPAKTPRKRTTQPGSALKATARVLFPTHPAPGAEAVPSPKKKIKKGRKYNGFSLDSFTGEEANDGEDGNIAIFTDSKDRVPELDENEENPFYVKQNTVQGTGSGVSKRRRVSVEVKRDAKVEKALNRDDGMVYVFRGKKMFRKFEDDADEWDETEDALGSTSPRLRPFTRSSIKPRLLFPSTAKADLADEEAVTDIEGQGPAGDSEMTDMAADTEEEVLVTPTKNTFTPASPPASGYATRRSTNKPTAPAPEPVEYLLVDTRATKKVSPFDNWQRGKAEAGSTGKGKGKKREGDVMERNIGSISKRVKSDTA